MARVGAPIIGKQLIKNNLKQCSVRYSPFKWLACCQRNVTTSISPDWDYETERRTFQLKTPEYYNFARDVIDKWADKEKTGDRGINNPAFWWINESGDEVKWSFQDLSQKSKVVANILTGPCKLKPGDLLIVILPRIPEWWLINLAAIRAGVILSPGTVLLRSKDIRHRINASGAKCLITISGCADYVDEAEKDCPTLQTKVIIGAKRYWLQLSSNDVFWNLSDTGWAKSAWCSLFSPWIAGACVFAQDSSKFDPGLMLKILHSYPIHVFCAPPTAVRLMQVEKDFTSLRKSQLKRCVAGGEPVNPELLDEWKEGTGQTLYEGYGQTETTFICGTYTNIKQKPGSMGKPSPGIDLKIVDTDGNILPQGEEGEIGIRCKPGRPVGLFSRYIDDERRMKRSFVGDFYLTGDRAILDEEGYVHFVGRSDDVILSSGYRIGPFEVESALLEHPAVLESAVVSSPDHARGEIVKAFVTLTDTYKNANKEELIAELQTHAKEITAPYKYPRQIEFVDTLPKTVSGKIRRVELRNKEWGRTTEE